MISEVVGVALRGWWTGTDERVLFLVQLSSQTLLDERQQQRLLSQNIEILI